MMSRNVAMRAINAPVATLLHASRRCASDGQLYSR